jgi:fatty-acyl-CoA synthase
LDDTIIVSGLNVYPTEIEDIILQHPKVTDAVIFKIEDAFAGFRVCLQYVTNEVLLPTDLRQWCSKHMATFQIPQVLQPVSEIARMANSKVNRKQIAEKYQADSNVNSALPA